MFVSGALKWFAPLLALAKILVRQQQVLQRFE
jgi:hypothetical protein